MRFPRTNAEDTIRGVINDKLGEHGCLSYEWLFDHQEDLGELHQVDLRHHAVLISNLLRLLPQNRLFKKDLVRLRDIQIGIVEALHRKRILYANPAMLSC